MWQNWHVNDDVCSNIVTRVI